MKAEPIKVSQLRILAKEPGEKVIFRQTRNWELKRWNCVQRRQDSGKWRKIENQGLVTKGAGWKFALWRVHQVMLTRADEYHRPHWKCFMFKILHPPYSTYYLICRRIHHSIKGVF